jgi:hypothetical protein
MKGRIIMSVPNVRGLVMSTKLRAILRQFIAEYHQGINEVLGHGTALDQAEQQIKQLIEELIPDREVEFGVKDKSLIMYKRGFNQAIDDMHERLGKK